MIQYAFLFSLFSIISCLNITLRRNLTNNGNTLSSNDFYLNNTRLLLLFNESTKGFLLSEKYLNLKAEYVSYINEEDNYNFKYEIAKLKNYPDLYDGIFGLDAFKEKFGTIFIKSNDNQTVAITSKENMMNEKEYDELFVTYDSLIYEGLYFDISKTEIVVDVLFEGILFPKKILSAIKKELKLKNQLDCSFKKLNKNIRFNNLQSLICQKDWADKLNEEKLNLNTNKGKGLAISIKKLLEQNNNGGLQAISNANLYFSDDNKIVLGLPFFQLNDVCYKNETILSFEKKQLTGLKTMENKMARKFLFFAVILLFVFFFAKFGYALLIKSIETNVRKIREEEEDKPINSFKGVFDEIKRLREVKQVTLSKKRKKKNIFEL